MSSPAGSLDSGDFNGTTNAKNIDDERENPRPTTSVYHIRNGLDVEVTVKPILSTASDFSYPVTGANSPTVATNSGGSLEIAEPWPYVRFEVTPTSAPSSGTIEIYEAE